MLQLYILLYIMYFFFINLPLSSLFSLLSSLYYLILRVSLTFVLYLYFLNQMFVFNVFMIMYTFSERLSSYAISSYLFIISSSYLILQNFSFLSFLINVNLYILSSCQFWYFWLVYYLVCIYYYYFNYSTIFFL